MVLKHQQINEPLFCKEAKLHGAQALQPLKITNVQGTQTKTVTIKRKMRFGRR